MDLPGPLDDLAGYGEWINYREQLRAESCREATEYYGESFVGWWGLPAYTNPYDVEVFWSMRETFRPLRSMPTVHGSLESYACFPDTLGAISAEYNSTTQVLIRVAKYSKTPDVSDRINGSLSVPTYEWEALFHEDGSLKSVEQWEQGEIGGYLYQDKPVSDPPRPMVPWFKSESSLTHSYGIGERWLGSAVRSSDLRIWNMTMPAAPGSIAGVRRGVVPAIYKERVNSCMGCVGINDNCLGCTPCPVAQKKFLSCVEEVQKQYHTKQSVKAALLGVSWSDTPEDDPLDMDSLKASYGTVQYILDMAQGQLEIEWSSFKAEVDVPERAPKEWLAEKKAGWWARIADGNGKEWAAADDGWPRDSAGVREPPDEICSRLQGTVITNTELERVKIAYSLDNWQDYVGLNAKVAPIAGYSASDYDVTNVVGWYTGRCNTGRAQGGTFALRTEDNEPLQWGFVALAASNSYLRDWRENLPSHYMPDDPTMVHEMIHTFGIFHANAYVNCDVLTDSTDDCDTLEYGNRYSIMGSGMSGYLPYSWMPADLLYQAHWLHASEVTVITTSGHYTIAPLNPLSPTQAASHHNASNANTLHRAALLWATPEIYFWLEFHPEEIPGHTGQGLTVTRQSYLLFLNAKSGDPYADELLPGAAWTIPDTKATTPVTIQNVMAAAPSDDSGFSNSISFEVVFDTALFPPSATPSPTTESPTAAPTPSPSISPTPSPTTPAPTPSPTNLAPTPSATTPAPTHSPFKAAPTPDPTHSPTNAGPTPPPTPSPTTALTPSPTTVASTPAPTTSAPTPGPTPSPTTYAPTPSPTTMAPTPGPTPSPTTSVPTPSPATMAPTPGPTPSPTTYAPTPSPTTMAPTPGPTPSPTTISSLPASPEAGAKPVEMAVLKGSLSIGGLDESEYKSSLNLIQAAIATSFGVMPSQVEIVSKQLMKRKRFMMRHLQQAGTAVGLLQVFVIDYNIVGLSTIQEAELLLAKADKFSDGHEFESALQSQGLTGAFLAAWSAPEVKICDMEVSSACSEYKSTNYKAGPLVIGSAAGGTILAVMLLAMAAAVWRQRKHRRVLPSNTSCGMIHSSNGGNNQDLALLMPHDNVCSSTNITIMPAASMK